MDALLRLPAACLCVTYIVHLLSFHAAAHSRRAHQAAGKPADMYRGGFDSTLNRFDSKDRRLAGPHAPISQKKFALQIRTPLLLQSKGSGKTRVATVAFTVEQKRWRLRFFYEPGQSSVVQPKEFLNLGPSAR